MCLKYRFGAPYIAALTVAFILQQGPCVPPHDDDTLMTMIFVQQHTMLIPFFFVFAILNIAG